MPYRKKLCLVVEEGNELTKYATFNNEKAAYAFMDLFADFMGVERKQDGTCHAIEMCGPLNPYCKAGCLTWLRQSAVEEAR